MEKNVRSITVEKDFDTVIENVKNELTKAGFGILFTVDVNDTFKQKLGVEFGPYMIFGICVPRSALAVLESEPLMGTMLPCHLAVYESFGKTKVAVFRPQVMAMMSRRNPVLRKNSEEFENRLSDLMEAIKA